MDSCLQLAGLKGLPAAAEGFNFVFSPLSLRASLSLMASAARGETQQQLLSFLASTNTDQLHSASSHLLQAIRDRGGDGDGDGDLLLSFVNAIWIDSSISLNPSFLELAVSVYDAAAESVEFINQAEIVEKKINDWIEEKTNKMIKNLIPGGTLNNSTRLVFANALYFKGKWEEQFDHSMTKANDFYLLDGSTVRVPFMSSRKKQFVSSSDTFTVLKLPYKRQQGGGHVINKSNFSMLIFLPNQRNGLHDLITRVASEPNFVDKHVPNQRIGVPRFMVPKFKFSFDFEASDALKSLGLRHVFSWGDSDLSGMCLEGGRELFVSKVYHKVAVEVDEEGTTAAAATVLLPMFGSRYSPAPVNFVADHPFLFVVREDATGAILFLGHVANPLVD